MKAWDKCALAALEGPEHADCVHLARSMGGECRLGLWHRLLWVEKGQGFGFELSYFVLDSGKSSRAGLKPSKLLLQADQRFEKSICNTPAVSGFYIRFRIAKEVIHSEREPFSVRKSSWDTS